MEVNYFGHVAITRALLDYIPEDGAIVYISSVQGRIAVPYRSSYSASKHAAQVRFRLQFMRWVSHRRLRFHPATDKMCLFSLFYKISRLL